MNKIEIVDSDSVRPSTYNPRTADSERLDLVKLSLQKLGWLLPIYADRTGEILSGHQRHLVATEVLGSKKVPVCFTKALDLDERKAINIAFNRGTNDMASNHTSRTLKEAILDAGVYQLANDLPDRDLSSTDSFRCAFATLESIDLLLQANKGRWVEHSRNVSRTLSTNGIQMPIVVDPSNRVVNGIGRLEYQAERGAKEILVVRVSEEESLLAETLLNLLTMDFDLHTRYSDFLRHNSFRRNRLLRNKLGRGFTFDLAGLEDVDLSNPRHSRGWKAHYGTSVVDFGAGHLVETQMLRDIGVEVSAFEPYRIVPGTAEISRSLARDTALEFLSHVKSGTHYTSVFCSSVFNSVPFREDRQKIATILAALASSDTKTFCYAISENVIQWQHASGQRIFTNERAHKQAQFVVDYEPGILLGELSGKPKIQKFHSKAEFENLLGEFFHEVTVNVKGDSIHARCLKPKPVDPALLKSALEFEFNLPFPDGSRLNLVNEALDAFAQRLNMPELIQ